MAKTPRKVSLINVADYPRSQYTAYWLIAVLGDDELGYRWSVKLESYEPAFWTWKGERHDQRPDAPFPQYPPDLPVKQTEYLKMSPGQQLEVRKAQDARRELCAKIYQAHPQAQHLLHEEVGVADNRDDADTAAQQWVLANIEKYRRPAPPASTEAGYALAMGPLGMVLDLVGEAILGLLRPLLALAFSTTIRNNRLTQVENALDGGAGAALWRIYDGSRPATCGAATTLLAELTCSDPAGSVASQQLTFSAITADASANATGTATWFRLVDSTGTCCVDGNVGTAGSDLNLNSTSINTGVQVSISSAVITEGNP